MKKLFTLTATIVFYCICSFAQQANQNAVIYFEKTNHDFGSIKEEAGPHVVTFKFTNTGNQPLVLSDVRASCGCTTPSWTKEPVLPGKTGSVTASYDSKNRPGKFTKSITITSNTEPATNQVTISGDVVPRPKGPEDFYPAKLGSLRLEASHMAFGIVKNNESVHKEMKIYNSGNSTIKLLPPANLPDWLSLSYSVNELAPAKEGVLKGTIDGKKRKDWGFETTKIDFPTNDSLEPVKSIYVSCTLEEFFPPMSEVEKAKAPKLSFDKTTFDFGKVKAGETVKTNFTMSNTGKSDLLIRKTKASCGCTLAKFDKSILKPGESTNFEVSFNSTGKKGKTSNTVTVICNDPTNHTSNLSITAEVEVLAAPASPVATPAPSSGK